MWSLTSIGCIFWCLGTLLGPSWRPFGGLLGPLGGCLAASWGPLGASWRGPGPKMPPRFPQEAPNSSHRAPQEPQNAPQRAPRDHKNATGRPQDALQIRLCGRVFPRGRAVTPALRAQYGAPLAGARRADLGLASLMETETGLAYSAGPDSE